MIDTVPTGRDKMIVLASNSPRRKELLRLISPGFEIEPAEIDERLDGNIPLDKMPEYLAVKKAEAVHKNHPDDIVIGCDTGVFINNMMILFTIYYIVSLIYSRSYTRNVRNI